MLVRHKTPLVDSDHFYFFPARLGPFPNQLENNPKCHYLFVVGEEDETLDSRYIALSAIKRLARHGCHSYQLLSYPDAGHLLEVPYCPVPESYFIDGFGEKMVPQGRGVGLLSRGNCE